MILPQKSRLSGKQGSMRVVIDTNIWISFLIGKALGGLSEAIIAERITILFSEELFAELIEVLQRPKFKKYFSSTAIEELIILLYDKVEWIEITRHFEDCLDKKDNFLLDLSVSGRADYLVTGDEDLLTLNPFHSVKIVSYRTFQAAFLAI
jgi:putative PIN family toxin of toxin-antitoxin system